MGKVHHAAMSGDANLVRKLLNEKKRKDGKAVMAMSGTSKPEYEKKFWVDEGKFGGSNGCTPLHLAATHGHLAVVAALIEAGLLSLFFFFEVNLSFTKNKPGAELETRTYDGEYGFTPLHLAAKNGRTATVNLLLAAGADGEAKTPSGKTYAQLMPGKRSS